MRTRLSIRSTTAAVIALSIASMTVPTLAHAKRMGCGARAAAN